MIKGGLQACSVTDAFLNDPYGTLKELAGYGYRYIESAGTMFTEELKAEDPMRWVGEMNNIFSLAEDIVMEEVIYS